MFAEDEAELLIAAATDAAQLGQFVDARCGGLPLEHVVGWVDFSGARYRVGPGVFVPRPRTKSLVAAAIEAAVQDAVIVDLCCGCGAVGAAIAAAVPGATLFATEIDPVAAQYAGLNLQAVGGTVFVGDLFDPLPPHLRGLIDLVVSVPPYVPTDALDLLPREARDFEPIRALDGGYDGLAVARDIVAKAPTWLVPGGTLLIEVADHQRKALAAHARGLGLTPTLADGESSLLRMRLG